MFSLTATSEAGTWLRLYCCSSSINQSHEATSKAPVFTGQFALIYTVLFKQQRQREETTFRMAAPEDRRLCGVLTRWEHTWRLRCDFITTLENKSIGPEIDPEFILQNQYNDDTAIWSTSAHIWLHRCDELFLEDLRMGIVIVRVTGNQAQLASLVLLKCGPLCCVLLWVLLFLWRQILALNII